MYVYTYVFTHTLVEHLPGKQKSWVRIPPEAAHFSLKKGRWVVSGGIRTHDFCFPGKCSTSVCVNTYVYTYIHVSPWMGCLRCCCVVCHLCCLIAYYCFPGKCSTSVCVNTYVYTYIHVSPWMGCLRCCCVVCHLCCLISTLYNVHVYMYIYIHSHTYGSACSIL